MNNVHLKLAQCDVFKLFILSGQQSKIKKVNLKCYEIEKQLQILISDDDFY